MTKCKITNMCMIEDGKGNVLVEERKKSWKGLAFPGGKVEDNESVYESVIREIKEETNLNISDLKFCGIKDWFDSTKKEKMLIFLFKTNKFDGTLLESSSEGKNYWVKKSELLKLDLAPGFENDLELFDDENFEIFWKESNNEWIREIK